MREPPGDRSGLATADLEELLRSPLDDPPEPLPGWVRWLVAGGALLIVALGAWILLDDDGETVAAPVSDTDAPAGSSAPAGEGARATEVSPAATTPPTATTATIPTTPGFPDVGLATTALNPASGLVVYGGVTPTGAPSDSTWIWDADLRQWLELDLLDRPPARVGAVGAGLDAAGTVIFGGGEAFQLISACQIGFCPAVFEGDTWLLDLDDGGWSALQPPNAPSPRNGAAMVAVPEDGVAMLYGGVGPPEGERTGILHGDTWIFDPEVADWRQVATDVAPSPRASHAMVHDPATGLVFLWGGRAESTTDPPTDLWAFDLATETWTEVDVQGEAPAGRWTHRWFLEPLSGELIMMGGQFFEDGSQARDPRMWSFDGESATWSPIGPELPEDASLVAADGTGGVIAVTHDGTVRWQVDGEPVWELVAEHPD